MTHVVTSRRSPNCNERPSGVLIDTIVLHSTASKSCQQDVEWLCTPLSKASAHVIIDRDGTIYDLVPVSRRAWHAGKSEFHGRPDVNDFSIGIELANDNAGEAYPDAQLGAAAALCAAYIREWPAITPERITSHAAIALPQGRKSDPFGLDLEAFRALVREELDR